MKLSIDVAAASPQAWIDAVMQDFDSFLQDHANCERKASSMAMSLIAKYPDREEILPELMDTAIEELEHFKQVYDVMKERGVPMPREIAVDLYVKELIEHTRTTRNERFLDRLLLASIIECRGAERFRLVYEHQEDPELKQFYHRLWASEAKHGHIFVGMALQYFPEDEVYSRLEELNNLEAEVMLKQPPRAALH